MHQGPGQRAAVERGRVEDVEHDAVGAGGLQTEDAALLLGLRQDGFALAAVHLNGDLTQVRHTLDVEDASLTLTVPRHTGGEALHEIAAFGEKAYGLSLTVGALHQARVARHLGVAVVALFLGLVEDGDDA